MAEPFSGQLETAVGGEDGADPVRRGAGLRLRASGGAPFLELRAVAGSAAAGAPDRATDEADQDRDWGAGAADLAAAAAGGRGGGAGQPDRGAVHLRDRSGIPSRTSSGGSGSPRRTRGGGSTSAWR